MQAKQGKLSIDAQNILPIIKKWLYSDRHIFVRELAANGCDAVTKLKALGEAGDSAGEVRITADKDAGTLTVSDDGIGMTADEIERYINRVAFSGAQEFMQKIKDAGEAAAGIIGHFGLGFYSAFMVADKVTIDSLSYQPGAQAAHWQSEGGLEYTLGPGSRKTRGTTVTLHLSGDSREYLDEGRLMEIAGQYLGFMPVAIYINDGDQPINDIFPLYQRPAKDITDEEYIAFYKKTFGEWQDPLFWVHLNIDYPFTLKGILYFPPVNRDYRLNEGSVRLYCRQVYVAENIKEIIPEHLLLLKGVIDSPDIPLNVSRSFLQNDSEVKALSAHISRKAADMLAQLHSDDPERYERAWDDISLFVKYGCMRDEKFYDRVKGSLLFRRLGGGTMNLDELLQGDGDGNFYVGADNQDAPIIELYQKQNIPMLLMPDPIDINFMSFLEYKESGLKFKRIDSEVAGPLSEGDADEGLRDALEAIMRRATGDDNLAVKLQNLADEETPAMLIYDEQMRRFSEANRLFGRETGITVPATLVLNGKSGLIKRLMDEDGDAGDELARHIRDLAELSQGKLDRERMAEFVRRSYRLLMR